MSGYHGDFVEEHGRLLQQWHVPFRCGQKGDLAIAHPLGDAFGLFQLFGIERFLQEIDRFFQFVLVVVIDQFQFIEEVDENGEELLDVVQRVFAIGVSQSVLDQRRAVLFGEIRDLTAAGQDDQVLVLGQLVHVVVEEDRFPRPAAVADDDDQRVVAFEDILVDEPRMVVIVDDVDVDGDLLVFEPSFDDVGNDRRASHAVEDQTIELTGFDSLFQAWLQVVQGVLVTPQKALEQRVTDDGRQAFQSRLHFFGSVSNKGMV